MTAPPTSARRAWTAPVLLVLLMIGGLYGGGVRYPLVFDDVYWFSPRNVAYLMDSGNGTPGLAVLTSVWALRLAGGNVIGLHVLIIGLHMATAILAFALFRRLTAAVIDPAGLQQSANDVATAAGLVSALVIALHPLAVHDVAYVGTQQLVQATMLGMVFLLAWLEGLLRRSFPLLCIAVLAYVSAVMSKPNVIMLPVVAGAMTVLVVPLTWRMVRLIALPAALCGAYALYVVHGVAGNLSMNVETGFAATQLATSIVADPAGLSTAGGDAGGQISYARSAVTQALHFFRYLLLWLLPIPSRLAIDLQIPLAPWPPTTLAWAGAGAFALWPLAALALLFRRGWLGLVGFALFWPWPLFLTELATVRWLEAFVLYRTYLWTIGLALLPAIAIARLPHRAAWGASIVLVGGLFVLAHGELRSFATPERVWDAAVAANRPYEAVSPAAYRAYVNRGIARLAAGHAPSALADFQHAARLAPRMPETHLDIAVAQERLGDYPAALAAMEDALALRAWMHPSKLPRAIANRAAILLRLDRPREALADLEQAAMLDPDRAEYRENAAKLRALLAR